MTLSELTPADALEILRQHHGLGGIAGAKRGCEAPYFDFEPLIGIALMHKDTTVAEILTPLIGMTAYDAGRLVLETKEEARPRLRLCAIVAGLILEISTMGLQYPSEKKRQVGRLKEQLTHYRMEGDPWNVPDKDDATIEKEYWNGLFLEIGLTARWPLADFLKSWNWAKSRLDKMPPSS